MTNQAVLSPPQAKYDYSLTGMNARLAVEKGLAEAEWYQCPIPREKLRKLLERRDGPAIRDTLLWFAIILGFAAAISSPRPGRSSFRILSMRALRLDFGFPLA